MKETNFYAIVTEFKTFWEKINDLPPGQNNTIMDLQETFNGDLALFFNHNTVKEMAGMFNEANSPYSQLMSMYLAHLLLLTKKHEITYEEIVENIMDIVFVTCYQYDEDVEGNSLHLPVYRDMITLNKVEVRDLLKYNPLFAATWILMYSMLA